MLLVVTYYILLCLVLKIKIFKYYNIMFFHFISILKTLFP